MNQGKSQTIINDKKDKMTEKKKKSPARKIRAYVLLTLVMTGLLLFLYKWYSNYTAFDKTDDAYIDAEKVSVSSKILGRIASSDADQK